MHHLPAYRPCTPADEPFVQDMMLSLYREDPSTLAMTPAKIARTLARFAQHPDQGAVWVFWQHQQRVGYAVLVHFWSNEYGGHIIDVDELYVAPDWRGRGLASGFLRGLATTRYADAVALRLEVTPTNAPARRLYASLGFVTHKNEVLTWELPA